jgi:stage II sporulation protein M
MIAIVNGYLIGFVANMVVSQEGVLVLWRLLPHGIFELPAIFISIGLGIWLGMGVFYDVKTLKHRLVSGLKVFLALILPLLVIAAIVEGILIGIGA